jgi:hypothetical protein
MAARTSIQDFSIANTAYALSTVTVYAANPDGSKGAAATLYANLSGLGTLPNPQTLDSDGKWQQPVYIDVDFILEIDSATASLDGDTGVTSFGGSWRGAWTGPGTIYYRNDYILGPAGSAEEDNVYISQSIWSSSGAWATDVADVTLLELALDYQALVALASAALPDATEAVKGKIELATQAETNTGTDDERAVTPLKLASRTATEARAGIAEIATQVETNAGANDTTIVSPAKLHARVASETLQGLIAIATQAEVNTGTNDTEAITPLKLVTNRLARATFFAHKNGVAQAGITSATDIQLTFSTESWDIGSHFAANAWTPPAGKYRISVHVEFDADNGVDQESLYAMIFKNGAMHRRTIARRNGASFQAVFVEALVEANGTDVFTAWATKNGAGNGQVNGASTDTWFCGESLF